jgi:hypothetical protein
MYFGSHVGRPIGDESRIGKNSAYCITKSMVAPPLQPQGWKETVVTLSEVAAATEWKDLRLLLLNTDY